MHKRLLCALIALCLLIGCVPAVETARAESYTVYVIADGLRVYQSQSTSSASMTVNFGESYICVGVEGGWAKLQNGPYYGYCALSGISLNNPNTYQKRMYAAADNVPVRAEASGSGRVMMYINTNDSYIAIAVSLDGAWTLMVNGPYRGYAESRYLSDAPVGTKQNVYVTANLLNVYASAAESSAVLNVASYGEAFVSDMAQNGWCRIEYGGGYGFCKIDGLSTTDPNVLSNTVYINADNVPVHRRPDAGSDVMMRVSKNAGYTARAITGDGAWYRLQNGAHYGYVESRFISAAPVSGDTHTIYVTANTLNVYTAPDATSASLGVMSYGESLLCSGVSNGWAQVKNNDGSVGYCQESGISTADPNTLSQNVYINADNVPVYRKATTGSDVMMYLPKNACYPVRAITKDGAFYRMQNGVYFGYVESKYISFAAMGNGQRVFITANTLRAYASPTEYSASLGLMSYGENMLLLETQGDWAKIQNAAGAIGFCRANGLSAADPNIYSQNVYVRQSGAVLYSKPNYAYPMDAAARVHETYTAVAITQDYAWVRLLYGGGYAYIESAFITDVPQYASAETVYIKDNTMPVYESASAESAVLGVMSYGESLSMQDAQDGWARVTNSAGQTGYCRYGSLTKVNPNAYSVPVYALDNGTAVRRKPANDAEIIRTVGRGAYYTGVAITADAGWIRVDLGNGSYGYMAVEELSLDKPAEEESAIVPVDPFPVYIIDNLLGCYATSDVNSAVLGVMSYGESFSCIAFGDGWAKIRNDAGAVGYCQISGLSIYNPNVAGKQVYPQVSGVPVYSKPSQSAQLLGTMRVNAVLTAIALTPDGQWLRLQNGGAVGYAEARYFSTTPVSVGASSKAAAVVELAQKQIGKPYVYAAKGPNTFDCSGLVGYVYYNAVGITLQRTAYAQGYDDRYAKISKLTDLQIGDLVFFDTSSDSDLCDHVGIYIGGGQFIHASSAGGKVITSSLLNNSYYARTFSWGRRVL